MLRGFFFFVACMATFFCNSINAAADVDQKVYLASEQVICTNHGIFVLLENLEGNLTKILVPQVNWDANGLFIYADYLPSPEAAYCRHGHFACPKCYRCDEPGCPHRGCRCRR